MTPGAHSWKYGDCRQAQVSFSLGAQAVEQQCRCQQEQFTPFSYDLGTGVAAGPEESWREDTPVPALFVFLFSFFLFRAAPVAYGSHQARGPIGATAAGLRHSSWQCWILNPLSPARDQTCILMDTSWVGYC